MRRFWNGRGMRKLRRNRLAMFCLGVIGFYLLIAAASFVGILSEEDTWDRAGPAHMPGFFAMPSEERRIDAAEFYLRHVERAMRRKSDESMRRAGRLFERELQPVDRQELQARIDRSWDQLEKADETPCRVIRGEVHEDQGARVRAGRDRDRLRQRFYILLKHVIPNTVHLMFINFSAAVHRRDQGEVILTFLGLGVKGQPSWGTMISQAKDDLSGYFFWEVGTATFFMFGLVLAFNIVTDALQDAFDPKHVSADVPQPTGPMNEPKPDPRAHLASTSFRTDRGVVTAVDDVSFDVTRARPSASSASPAAARPSPASRSCGCSPSTSRIYGEGERDPLRRREPRRRQRDRDARASAATEIAMIFQEPMTSLNPVFTVGWQIDEALRYHTKLEQGGAPARAIEMLKLVEIPNPEQRVTSTRTSSRAACASAS
jgi:hypothetical protein